MAVEVSRDRPWADAICPVCAKYFTDPVSLECGHNFCRSCITRCWEELPVDITCPRWCTYFLEGRKSEPNRELADFVEATKQSVERMKEEAERWANCAEHQLPLNLFCEDDQAALCSQCKRSEAHRNHSVVGVDLMDQIDAYIDIPDEMRSELSIYKGNSITVTQEWLKRTEAERKKTVATFKNLHQFLDDQEHLRLAKLVELEKEIVRKMEEYPEKVSDQITFLDDVYIRLGDLYNDNRQFLQEFGGALYGYDDKQLENPVLLPTDVKDKIQKFCDRKLFLEEVLKEFNDEMAALLKGRRRKRTRTEVVVEERGTRVDVTLDQDTAYRNLVITADRKKMFFVEFCRDFWPIQPKRFQMIPCVLGRQAFTSGRHWWEVKVEGKGLGWAVGVARESLKRSFYVNIWDWDAEGIWVVGKQTNRPSSPRRLLASSRPKAAELFLTRKPEKIRVCLDYPGAQVAFFDAETDESIFVFHSCSFLGEKVCPFFWLIGLSVTLCC
ncbi:UNVERIFIED_CONTAM: hypothetical protein K2H54_061225 [Gekko kuhli]